MTDTDPLFSLRRRLHRYPEPAWCEVHTTGLLVEELSRTGVDEIAVGRETMDPDHRMAVPGSEVLEEWHDRARERGTREDVLAATEGGYTGVVGVLDRGPGPTIGLRVDIDGLYVAESEEESHRPASEGFRSENEGVMHACGHDAHMAIGLGVIERVAESAFEGRLVVFFQPAEEVAGGGKPMAFGPYAEDLEYFFAVHVGLDHPTGEVVAGIVEPLAMCHLRTVFWGTSAHAGQAPQEGRDAIAATATAVSNVNGIPRHSGGATRLNVGRIDAGSASNVVADRAKMIGEVRGETTDLMEYMKGEYDRIVAAAAEMHGCSVSQAVEGECPRSDSDPALAEIVAGVAAEHEAVDSVVDSAPFGASEDATFFMDEVQKRGGLATYAIVGTDHPAGHHSPGFDVDERSIPIGVDVLAEAIERTAETRPTLDA
ncbi:amidohydrolase [Natronorarus salvus]|uniref:amidohydrolase n=1 Tax=Natronorarus salvus TaxID=3117733 RepID=UPI002F268D1F